jgi:hypothetical protein
VVSSGVSGADSTGYQLGVGSALIGLDREAVDTGGALRSDLPGLCTGGKFAQGGEPARLSLFRFPAGWYPMRAQFSEPMSVSRTSAKRLSPASAPFCIAKRARDCQGLSGRNAKAG